MALLNDIWTGVEKRGNKAQAAKAVAAPFLSRLGGWLGFGGAKAEPAVAALTSPAAGARAVEATAAAQAAQRAAQRAAAGGSATVDAATAAARKVAPSGAAAAIPPSGIGTRLLEGGKLHGGNAVQAVFRPAAGLGLDVSIHDPLV